MGRKLTFSKEEAVASTMHLFWAKGYEATTVRDIADRLEIPVASVYHSFGDKRSIFLMTLDAYFEAHIRPNFENLALRTDSKQALLDLFDSMAKRAGGEGLGS